LLGSLALFVDLLEQLAKVLALEFEGCFAVIECRTLPAKL
jgi:hypothetical protein